MLEQRTLTDKGIFYTPGGLPRAERELAATVTSKINGCIYCASVHARKAAQLAKDETAVDTLLAVTPGENLSDGQSPRWQAEIDAAAALSVTPPGLNARHLAALDEQGFRYPGPAGSAAVGGLFRLGQPADADPWRTLA